MLASPSVKRSHAPAAAPYTVAARAVMTESLEGLESLAAQLRLEPHTTLPGPQPTMQEWMWDEVIRGDVSDGARMGMSGGFGFWYPAALAGHRPAGPGADDECRDHTRACARSHAADRSPHPAPGDASSTVDSVASLREHAWAPGVNHRGLDQLWAEVRGLAVARMDPLMYGNLHTCVLSQPSLGGCLAQLLGSKLGSRLVPAASLVALLGDLYAAQPDLLEAASADVQATVERDPACLDALQCLLHCKGWQALQAHRAGAALWAAGRTALALALQSRGSEVWGVDIHPAARIGRGILMDHGTGVVIGETARVGDGAALLHGVTLGGSGTGRGARHPTVGNGVLLGAGVSVLGPVTLGHCARVGAGSVVVQDVPPHGLAVGIPAKLIRRMGPGEEPCKSMNQSLSQPDYNI